MRKFQHERASIKLQKDGNLLSDKEKQKSRGSMASKVVNTLTSLDDDENIQKDMKKRLLLGEFSDEEYVGYD